MNDLENAVLPSDYGAVLWGGLHTLGHELYFTPAAWRGYVLWMRRVLSPALSPATGCAECSGHFEAWCEAHSPLLVRHSEQATRWGWEAHNEVRKRQGKPLMSYEDACALWDW